MLAKYLRKIVLLDAFPKVDAGYQHSSTQGGCMTVFVSICLWFLILSEFREYLTLNQKYKFVVDSSIGHHMDINVDITVAMPCSSISIDELELTGERTNLDEVIRTVPAKFEVRSARKLREFLLSEIDMDVDIRKLIKDARAKGWNSGSEVPADDTFSSCRIYGSFAVNKVAGNFHITAVGQGYIQHQVMDKSAINFTHRIDEFSFGTLYPKLVNPLDDSVEITDQQSGLLILSLSVATDSTVFKYFISVVPTTYVDNSGRTLLTNQYAVTDYSKDIEFNNEGVPGIFFSYEIEPISVHITEKRSSFAAFLEVEGANRFVDDRFVDDSNDNGSYKRRSFPLKRINRAKAELTGLDNLKV
ncbi:11369_t:CDS:10 [Paraglomus occultum]|uniref:11369_t:CDS:1 n=1 Tax=Paraglomus occultum TaxID=144539 RepID=A0A9N9CW52_9GLOM|nr:11369_t:CDS:10 [Paraglomus occultum]